VSKSKLVLGLWLGLLGAGCGLEDAQTIPIPGVNVQQENYLLSAEPAGARSVTDVRMDAPDKAQVVVVGRIAGGKEPLVAGRAAFTIVDLALEPCEDESPWVYCCTPPEDLAQAMVLVKFVDGDGKTLTQDARTLLGVKEWTTVVVHGHVQRDEAGQLRAIVADGLFVRP